MNTKLQRESRACHTGNVPTAKNTGTKNSTLYWQKTTQYMDLRADCPAFTLPEAWLLQTVTRPSFDETGRSKNSQADGGDPGDNEKSGIRGRRVTSYAKSAMKYFRCCAFHGQGSLAFTQAFLSASLHSRLAKIAQRHVNHQLKSLRCSSTLKGCNIMGPDVAKLNASSPELTKIPRKRAECLGSLERLDDVIAYC
ncbi:hypothetical protein JZ751_017090 [Albula glossodonta]|uniref:Uncharacterized protein n=1 Tax=Albula glossodonta TaxID=121402 RepID=A0A8T2NMR4_9TELE|nr:hypothetical protein JZ751_017090 [Albula glossodonta]